MILVWRARAIAQMRNIYAHIARYTDPAHAYEVLAEIHQQINGLVDNPQMGRRGHQRGTYQRVIKVGLQTYRCTYRISGQTIYIGSVRDTRQQGA
ncbi:MAG TPA: type II toxin-antitoxin system RelE/ParE family toxin [Chloroflexota bacterium]|nr:type II toxin-antitoxin system RelE/ParE family toxin [Chloroflexota bacterium]